MQAASYFLSGLTVIDENGVFDAVMEDIVTLPVKILLMSSNLVDIC